MKNCCLPALHNLLGNCSLLVVVVALVVSSHAQKACPPQNPKTKGWKAGSTIKINLTGFSSSEQKALTAAFNAWNAANTALGITFQSTTDPNAANVIVVPGLAGGAPARTTYATDSSGILTAANTAIATGNQGAPAGQKFFDNTQSNYSSALTKVMLHELGHTLGLGEEPSAAGACGGQAAGNTAMNGECGTNDNQNNLPTAPTTCDKNSIAQNPQCH